MAKDNVLYNLGLYYRNLESLIQYHKKDLHLFTTNGDEYEDVDSRHMVPNIAPFCREDNKQGLVLTY